MLHQRNLEALRDAIAQAPVQFQDVKFDEDREAALRFAEWLITRHAVLLLDALTQDEWVKVLTDLVPPHLRAMLAAEADASETASLLAGTLKNLVAGEPVE